jgi:hypothetical protein
VSNDERILQLWSCRLYNQLGLGSGVSDSILLVWLIGGELTLHFIFKIVRGEYICYFRVEGPLGYIMSFIWHLITKVIADFR